MNSQQSKDLKSFAIRILISGLLLWYLFSKIDFKSVFVLMKQADMRFLFFALIANTVIVINMLYRWFIFIKALHLKVKSWDVVRFYCAGLFGNLFLPSAMGGDIIKIVGLCHQHDEKPKVVASVLLDRLSGFASIAIVAVLAFAFGYKAMGSNFLLIPVLLLLVGSISVGFILFNSKVYGLFCRIFDKFPKVKSKVMQMHYDISLMKDQKKAGIWAIAVSCFNQVIFSLVFFLLAHALHQNISFIYFLLFVPLICVFASIPSLGGLGVREAGTAYLFSKIGLEPSIGVSLSLMVFLLMVISGIVGGAFYVLTVSHRRV